MCFLWRDVLACGSEDSWDALAALAASVNGYLGAGCPWYAADAEVVHMCGPDPTPLQAVHRGLPGAAFVACDAIAEGAEVLFDYQLQGPPYPPWAAPWYSPALSP